MRIKKKVMNFLLHSQKKKKETFRTIMQKKRKKNPTYLNSGNFKTPDCATFHLGDIILFAILFPKDIFSPQYKIIPLNFPVSILELYFYIYAILLLFLLSFYSSLPLQSPDKIALLMT